MKAPFVFPLFFFIAAVAGYSGTLCVGAASLPSTAKSCAPTTYSEQCICQKSLQNQVSIAIWDERLIARSRYRKLVAESLTHLQRHVHVIVHPVSRHKQRACHRKIRQDRQCDQRLFKHTDSLFADDASRYGSQVSTER